MCRLADQIRIAALFAIVALIVRAPALLHVELNWDEALYWRIASEVRGGDLPYTLTWDRKPPGLFLLLAAWQGVAGETIAALRLGTTAAVVVSALLLRALAKRLLPGLPAAGTLAGLFYIAASMRSSGEATNAELLLAPFALGAMALALAAAAGGRGGTWRAASAGVLGSCAVLIKQVAIGEGVATLVALLLLPRLGAPAAGDVIRLAAAMAAGLLLPPALIAGLYAAQGSLPLLLATLLAAGEAGFGALNVQGLIAGLRDYAPLTLAAVAGLALLAWGRGGPAARVGAVALAVWIGSIVAILLVLGRFADHMMIQLLAPLSLAAAAAGAIAIGIPAVAPRRRPAGFAALALLAVVWGSGEAANAGIETIWRRQIDGIRHWGDRTATLAAVIRDRVDAPGQIYVAGRTLGLYQQIGVAPPTRFPFAGHLWSTYAPVDGPAEIARIMAERPRFVVVDDLWMPGGPRSGATQVRVLEVLHAALAPDYLEEGHVGRFISRGGGFVGGGIGATVFRRRDMPPWLAGSDRLLYTTR